MNARDRDEEDVRDTLDLYRSLNQFYSRRESAEAEARGDTVPVQGYIPNWRSPGLKEQILRGLGAQVPPPSLAASYSSLRPSMTPISIQRQAAALPLSPLLLLEG